ncbi:tetratricopeptide repeat protein [Candidatus Omnitrophota bacterium]
MSKKHQSLDIVFWSVALMCVGLLCAFFLGQELFAFFDAGEAVLKAEGDLLLSNLFINCPIALPYVFFMMRFATVLVCFISAGLLYLQSPLILWFLRILSFFACGISLINPDYVFVEKIMLVSFQTVFMLYLFRQKTEMRFEMTDVEKDYFVENISITEIEGHHSRSWWVRLVAFIEFFVGVLLLNAVLWQIPYEGLGVDLGVVSDMPISLVLDRWLLGAASLFLCIVAFMTLQFNVWGRKINIYFSIGVFVISVCAIFFLQPVKLLGSWSFFSVFLFCAMGWSFCVVFLLSHPSIKQQFFSSHAEECGQPWSIRRLRKHFYFILLFIFIFCMFFMLKRCSSKENMNEWVLSDASNGEVFFSRDKFLIMVDKMKIEDDIVLGRGEFKEKMQELKIFLRNGNFDQAQQSGLLALDFAEEHFGSSDLMVAECLSLLGRVFFFQNQHDLALDYFKRVLDIDQKIYGTSDLRLVSDLSNLATVYQAVNKPIDAGLLYKRAIKILKSQYDHEHEGVKAIESKLLKMRARDEPVIK